MGLPLTTEPLDPAHPEELGYRIPREQLRASRPGPRRGRAGGLASGLGRRPAGRGLGPEGDRGRLAEAGGCRDRRRRTRARRFGRGGPGRRSAWPPCPAAIWSRRRSGPSPTAGGSGSCTGRRSGWWTPGGCRSGGASGTWPASTTDAARSGCSASTAWPARCRSGPPGAFARPPASAAGPPPPWRLGDDDEIVAELLVDAEQARWALEALGAEAVTDRRPDGAVVFSVAVTNVPAFRSFVLGFLDHAEILGPPALRADMVEWLGALAAGRARAACGSSVAKPSAEDRLGRLLAIVPWVAAHDGPQVVGSVPPLRGGGEGAAGRPGPAVPVRRAPVHAGRADRCGRGGRAGLDPHGGLLPPALAAEPAGGAGAGVGGLGAALGPGRRSRWGAGDRPGQARGRARGRRR